MKILIVMSDTYLGGSQRIMYELAMWIKHNTEHDIRVKVLNPHDGPYRELLFDAGLLSRAKYKWADIIHFDGFVADSFKIETGIDKWIDTIHSDNSMKQCGLNGDDRSIKVCVSKWLYDYCNSKNKVIIHNGIDTSLFKPDNASKPNKKNVVAVGRIHPCKDYRRFAEIALMIRDKRSDIDFYILGDVLNGDDKLQTELLDYLKGLGFINLAGSVNPTRMASSLPHFWLLLNTSPREGFGINLIEAMACGIPCVTVDNWGCRDIIKNGVDGHYETNNEIIRDRILFLLDEKNEKRYLTVSKKAREKAVKAFDIKKMVKKYLKVYNEIGG